MNNPDKNSYTWMDIIESDNVTETIPAWEYLLISLSVIIAIVFVIRYFNIHLRVKLWLLNYNLARSNNTKETARKLVTLLQLDKDTTYIETTLHVNKESGIYYRHELLKACYASKTVERQHINTLLKNISQWLR